MTKRVSLMLIFAIMASALSISATANSSVAINDSSSISSEQKVYSNATLDDDFSDDSIIVIMKNDISLEFNTFNTLHFPEVQCSKITDLSDAVAEKMEKKVDIARMATLTMDADIDSLDLSGVDTFNQVLCLELNNTGKDNVLKAIKSLQDRDDILYAGPNYSVYIAESMNDEYANSQWALSTLQIPYAWDISTGSSSVSVGVIDTGIDTTHPDLLNAVALVNSWDFTQDGEEYSIIPNDPHGHGTHVAGIICAYANNSSGIAGACQNITLHSLRVFDTDGSSCVSYIAAAINHAERKGIQIINLSLSAPADEGMCEAIENYSGLCVIAAGNYGSNNDVTAVYPANYRNLRSITVGNSTSSNGKAYDSCYGLTTVDIFAPGTSILSCYPTSLCVNGDCNSSTHYSNGYHILSGTSMAAPYVTAIAALMLSENPDLTPVQIRQRILDNCTPSTDLSQLCVSGGVANAYRSVLNAYSPSTLTLSANTYISMSQGARLWYKFVAPTTGNYSFYTTGSLDTIGELFDYSTGLIEYCDDVYSPDDGAESDYNFSITAQLSAGQTVYLRISANDWRSDGAITLYTTNS